MIGLKRRGARLQWMCGLGIALVAAFAFPARVRAQNSAATAQQAPAQTTPTQTTLDVGAAGMAGAVQTSATASVYGADGQPAKGIVNFEDGSRLLAQTTLNADGGATARLTLLVGDHALRAVYLGDAAHQSSVSDATQVQTLATGSAPGFQVSLTPVSPSTLPMTLTPGNSGSVTVTVTPVNNAALTGPMFVTLSCSGLPTLASCSFTPENLEISSSTPASCPADSAASACPPTSLMVISTEAQGGGGPHPPANQPPAPVRFSLLLPGILGLGGMTWGARRRRWLQRVALTMLIGLVATLGMTACNPYYYYYNHGPTPDPATPAGAYTVTVTAQSTNGVTAISSSTNMVLTVQ